MESNAENEKSKFIDFQSRWQFLEGYGDRHNVEQCIKNILPSLKAYAYIYHDKDIKEDGTPKQGHWHVLLAFKEDEHASKVRGLFMTFTGQNWLNKKVKSKIKAYEYLTHTGIPEKHRYPDEDVTDFNMAECISVMRSCREDRSFEIISDIMARVPLYSLAKKYGKDFIYHYTVFKTLAQDINSQEMKKEVATWEINDETGEI